MANLIIVILMFFFTLGSIYSTDAGRAKQMPNTNNSLSSIP